MSFKEFGEIIEPASKKEYGEIIEEPGFFKSVLSAPFKGIVEGLQGVNPLQPSGPIPMELGKRVMEQILPSREEHEPLRRAGKVASVAAIGPEGLLSKGLQVAGGTLLGELAEQEGLGEFGQSLSEAGGMGLGGALKGVTEKGIQALRGVPDKLKSGLTKLSAVESKTGKLGTITPNREKAVIQKLDKEAAKLAHATVEKHLPAAKQIEKGLDFDAQSKIRFQNLRKSAEQANPDVDTKPISKFMSEHIKKYTDIPNPNPEAKKVIQEIKAFRKRPATELYPLLKVFRDNNKKISHIYETSFVTGKQREYVDFLLDMNKSIVESFSKTLPEDSAWLNQFKKLNKEFSDYQAAKKTVNNLKGILSASPKLAEIEKLATDSRTQGKLTSSMGKQGAQEIIQIAQDLKATRDALKNVKKARINKFDHAFPLYFFIPYIGKFLGGYKAVQELKYGYGWLLSSPSRRTAYREALQAFIKDDLDGYKKAALKLKREMEPD